MYRTSPLNRFDKYRVFMRSHYNRMFEDWQFGENKIYTSRNELKNVGMYYILNVNDEIVFDEGQFKDLKELSYLLEKYENKLLNMSVSDLNEKV